MKLKSPTCARCGVKIRIARIPNRKTIAGTITWMHRYDGSHESNKIATECWERYDYPVLVDETKTT